MIYALKGQGFEDPSLWDMKNEFIINIYNKHFIQLLHVHSCICILNKLVRKGWHKDPESMQRDGTAPFSLRVLM